MGAELAALAIGETAGALVSGAGAGGDTAASVASATRTAAFRNQWQNLRAWPILI